jgi:uncharacterized protein (DUF433 family)
MNRIDWQKHITISPQLHHGDPCIKGTRVPVSTIIGSLADGMTADDIIDAYPQLQYVHIQAALAYAADMMHQDTLISFAA